MRVVLAMSGGVDSSASALLLKQQGHEVIGLFMRSGATEETACALPGQFPIVSTKSHKQGCCSASDAADARRVADALDIPFHALNFQDAFGRIKDYFADEYLAGRTPNPCVMCNNWLKFGRLWDFARQVGAERIATGHYARLTPASSFSRSACSAEPHDEDDGRHAERAEARSHAERGSEVGQRGNEIEAPALVRGRDRTKDQSYVLFGIRRELLDRVLFPVGDFEKTEIRELSRRAGIRTAEKKDSQEICFIPDNDYAGFLRRYRGEFDTAGEFVDPAGRVLGRHDGYHRFTIGQRKGLGIAFGEPRFVVAIEPETRRVVLGQKSDLERTTLTADRVNWLVEDVPSRFRCVAQIRYHHEAAACEVVAIDDGLVHVEFYEPQYGVAPGQALVMYDGERVLGGGWIRQE